MLTPTGSHNGMVGASHSAAMNSASPLTPTAMNAAATPRAASTSRPIIIRGSNAMVHIPAMNSGMVPM